MTPKLLTDYLERFPTYGAKEIAYKVDPSILGGMILRSGDKVVDASVRSNLQGLAAQMR